MKTLKTIALSIFGYISMVILVVIVTLTTLFTYFSLQTFIFSRGDSLLFVSGGSNMIPIIMIMILLMYAFFNFKDRFFKRKDEKIVIQEDYEPIDDIEKLSKMEKFQFKIVEFMINRYNKIEKYENKIRIIFKKIKICYIIILLIAIYCGMTSYAILYSDRIKLSSPINPKGVIYKYRDIKGVDVGIIKENKNSYSPYYKVIFDNKSVDFFGATNMNEGKDIGFEYILLDLDEKLREQGVTKSVDKENFENYAKRLDKDFISRVEKLFDEK